MKIRDIEKLIEDNALLFPVYLDKQVTIDLLLDNSPEDYPDEFGTTKKLFDPILASMFPKKDKKESINKYLKRIITENNIVPLDPKALRQKQFLAIYAKGKPFNASMIKLLSEEELKAYTSFAESMHEAKKYE